MSVTHKGLLLLKNATVSGDLDFGVVCNEKHVNVAYNNEPGLFEVRDGEMVSTGWYSVRPYVRYASVAWEWEIQAAFFLNIIISPHTGLMLITLGAFWITPQASGLVQWACDSER